MQSKTTARIVNSLAIFAVWLVPELNFQLEAMCFIPLVNVLVWNHALLFASYLGGS